LTTINVKSRQPFALLLIGPAFCYYRLSLSRLDPKACTPVLGKSCALLNGLHPGLDSCGLLLADVVDRRCR
jgi:hypothetical protein